MKIAAGFVLSRRPHCDVPWGCTSRASLPAASLDDHLSSRMVKIERHVLHESEKQW
jgi:hypothetical protein